MKDYFFISETDGNLYDTRKKDWEKHPLRLNYKRTHLLIKNVSDLKSTLRAGKYSWPGGYPLYFITEDGESLSFQAVRENFRNIINSIANNIDDGWKVISCDINYENTDLVCSDTGKLIESAYS